MSIFDFFKSKPAANTENQSESNNYTILHDDGIRAMKMGEVRYAEKCFSQALALQDDLQMVKLLAEAKIRLQDFEEALPLIERIAEAEPENADVYLILAQTYGILGQYEKMEDVANQLLGSYPENPHVLYLYGEACHYLGENSPAITYLSMTLEQQPRYIAPRLLRAQIFLSEAEYDKALEDANVLTELDAENEDVLLLRADALAGSGQAEAAEAAYESLLALNPFCQEGVLHCADFYRSTARYEKALQVCNEAIELEPGFALAYRLRSDIKKDMNDEAGAAEDLRKSLDLQPEESASADGEFTTVENKMAERYRDMNPYGF